MASRLPADIEVRGPDGSLLTEKDLEQFANFQAFNEEKGFFWDVFFPHFRKQVTNSLLVAQDEKDLLRAQGALRFLEEQEDWVRSRAKKVPKFVL